MGTLEINQLIREKLHADVKDQDTRNFIEDILKIERDYKPKRGKINEYEKTLAKYVRME